MSTSHDSQADAISFAVRSPRGLLGDPRFWRRHLDYLWLLAAGGLIAFLLLSPASLGLPFDLVPELEDGGASGWLGLLTLALIVMVALRSVTAGAGALAETQVEVSIAEVVEVEADRWLARLLQAPGERIELASLRAMIPANRSKPEPAMVRLAQEIVREARNLRLDARFYLLPRYIAESVTHVHRMERLQKHALRLGILGTFLGLILALGSFAPILGAAGGATTGGAAGDLLATGGRELIESLRLSFGTSIAGLTVALFIAAQAELVRNRQLIYYRRMEDACHSLTALAGRTLQREDLLSGLEASTQALREVQAQLYDQSRKVEQGLAAIEGRIGQQTAGISDAMEHLDRMRETWEHQLVGMRRGVEELLGGVRELGEHPVLRRLAEDLQELEGKLEDRIAAELGSGFERLVGEVEDLGARVGSVDEGLGGAVTSLQRRLDGLVETAGSIRDHVSAAAESSERSLREVPPALHGLRARLEEARRDGVAMLDQGQLKTALAGCSFGLVFGMIVGDLTTALVGLVVGPWLAFAVTRLRRAR